MLLLPSVPLPAKSEKQCWLFALKNDSGLNGENGQVSWLGSRSLQKSRRNNQKGWPLTVKVSTWQLYLVSPGGEQHACTERGPNNNSNNGLGGAPAQGEGLIRTGQKRDSHGCGTAGSRLGALGVERSKEIS